MTTAAIIVAGGSGVRVGGDVPKQYQSIAGEAVFHRTLRLFADHPGVDIVQPVIGAGHEEMFARCCADIAERAPVIGGDTRQQSVRNGLEALADAGVDKVLIHDAARPFCSPSLISHVIAWLDRTPAVIPGLPIAETVKRARAGKIVETVPRQHLWTAQTPQGFAFDDILTAHRRAAAKQVSGLTDDASVAEWAGHEVAIIAGHADNIKLTTGEDMDNARRRQAALLETRTGQGFDVHAFGPGDHVTLCGVDIAHDRALKGHSDADVAMHALTDAILGALCEGDIGAHFPPSDPQWKGAASHRFLEHACRLAARAGGHIVHCDVTIICETPKLRPHVDAMRARLADIMAVDIARVSVKATTSERLGFTGRGEGIAAMATATLGLPPVD